MAATSGMNELEARKRELIAEGDRHRRQLADDAAVLEQRFRGVTAAVDRSRGLLQGGLSLGGLLAPGGLGRAVSAGSTLISAWRAFRSRRGD